MSTPVYLIRHGSHAELGDVLSGRSDIGLSAEGRTQAAALGDWFSTRGIASVHASPRERARQTADAIARVAGVPVSIDDALDEIDFGAWTGQRFAELAGDPAWRAWNTARDVALPPEGEPMAAAADRAFAGVTAIAAGAAGPVALVSHADIIRGIVARVLGLSLDRLLAFDVAPASVTTLSVGRWGSKLVALNERPA